MKVKGDHCFKYNKIIIGFCLKTGTGVQRKLPGLVKDAGT